MTVEMCPSCNGRTVEMIGDLVGQPGLLDLQNPGRLYRCRTCSLYFRRPFFSTVDLAEIYARLPETYWQYRDGRNDHRLAYKAIMRRKDSGRVLDVGCYRGDFLQHFPERFSKYGIEPSRAAVSVAESRGIRIIGDTVETLESDGTLFDVITLIDVLEHLPFPFQAVSHLARLLSPNGILVVSTGNTNALPWRLMRLAYWYYLTEHVSFFNPSWCRWTARQAGLRVSTVRKFSYVTAVTWRGLYQLIQGVVYLMINGLSQRPTLKDKICSIYPFNKAGKWQGPPKTFGWKDHMLVVFTKL